jgi:hypothetical protein
MKLDALERHLRNHGCVFHREGGAHTIIEELSPRTKRDSAEGNDELDGSG